MTKPLPHTHYCSYCRYYGTHPITGDVDKTKDFTGIRAAVVRHAKEHPLGDPEDYPILLTDDEETDDGPR